MLQLPRFYGLEKNRTPAEREQFVRTITAAGYDPRGVGAVIDFESAQTWSPSVKGPAGTFSKPPGYPIGLIQFSPDTAERLGTTTAKLAQMSFGEQLGYVVAYYGLFGGPSSFSVPGDYYLAGWGANPRTPNTTVLSREGSATYSSNKGLDLNKDGVIYAGELRELINRRIASAESRGVWTFDETPQSVPVYRVTDPQGNLLGTIEVSEVDAPGSTTLTAIHGEPTVIAYPDGTRTLRYSDQIAIPARSGMPVETIGRTQTRSVGGVGYVGGIIALAAVAVLLSAKQPRSKPNAKRLRTT